MAWVVLRGLILLFDLWSGVSFGSFLIYDAIIQILDSFVDFIMVNWCQNRPCCFSKGTCYLFVLRSVYLIRIYVVVAYTWTIHPQIINSMHTGYHHFGILFAFHDTKRWKILLRWIIILSFYQWWTWILVLIWTYFYIKEKSKICEMKNY